MIPLKSQRVFIIHPKKNTSVTLPDRIEQLVTDQRRSWKRLSDGYAALAVTKTRTIECEGFSVVLQFNPERIVSTGARVDDLSIRARTCFLCVENLPEEQRGILYQDTYLILCNPAPIFERHCTVSSIDHREQTIEGSWKVFLDLARELSPQFTIFYNGPKCGASAPDHMHFQLCPSGVLPVERDVVDGRRKDLRINRNEVSVYTIKNYSRQTIVIESGDQSVVEQVSRELLDAMRSVLKVSEEPMVNVLCSFTAGTWRTIIFPRSKHRPDVYFRKGDERVLVSPAAVDMGGFIVTPIEKDFRSIQAKTVEDIYREVTLDADVVTRVLHTLEETILKREQQGTSH